MGSDFRPLAGLIPVRSCGFEALTTLHSKQTAF